MTEIIQFGEVARLRQLLTEKDQEIETLRQELKEAKIRQNTLDGIADLLQLQLADMQDLVREWRLHLATIEQNLNVLADKIKP